MNIAPKPPLARQGQKLASHGRYGDTELVHMNPYEVQGLAAMSPTGQLTKNPVTGQPEAFLPFLAPLATGFLGKALGTKLLGGALAKTFGTKLGATLAGSIGAGAAEGLRTGSFEKGILTGLTAATFGSIGQKGIDAANLPREAAALSSAQDVASKSAQELAKLGQPVPDLGSAMLGSTSIPKSGFPTLTPAMEQAGALTNPINAFSPNFSPAQADFLSKANEAQRAAQAVNTARQSLSFTDKLGSFVDPAGLGAMGRAALEPQNLLGLGVGLGGRAQLEAQEAMQRRADEAAAADSRYAQGFRNVLTDSLGMARGSNPNPYISQYIGNYAGGGVVGMNGGGTTDNYDDLSGSVIDIAGLQGPFVTGRRGDDGTLGDNLTYEQVVAASPQRQEEGRYFIVPKPDSAGERQAFLRGGFKQDPPTDYRHGFEEEYKFFDFIGDRDLDRTLDLFGSGPSDYLAGLLAATPERLEELDTPTAEGTLPLAEYTTTKGQQFSGVDNFSDMGVGKMEPIVNQPPTTDSTPVDPTPVDPTPVDPTPVLPLPDPTYMDAIRGLGIELDQDYDRPEGRQVFDVLEEFGVSGDEVVSDLADYFGVTEDYVEDNIDVIAQNRATKEILDKAIEGGIEQVDPGETAVDAYTEGEKDAVFGLLQDGTLSIPAAAEYFQLPVSEVTAVYESMLAENEQEQAVAEQALESANEQLRAIERSQDALDAAEQDQYGFAIGASGGRMPSRKFAGGGKTDNKKTRFMTSMGMVEFANGGMADALPVGMSEEVVEQIPDPAQLGSMVGAEEAMFGDGMGGMDYDNLVAATIEAVRGNVENADEVIEMFIAEYGVDEFRRLREAVLQSIVPDARTEGMIQGSTGGMDDEVMGMIGEDQGVAVSPGEYIVAADVVSGLGDGNSDAGADVLDQMMDDVRAARTGGRQPAPINKSAVMPA